MADNDEFVAANVGDKVAVIVSENGAPVMGTVVAVDGGVVEYTFDNGSSVNGHVLEKYFHRVHVFQRANFDMAGRPT